VQSTQHPAPLWGFLENKHPKYPKVASTGSAPTLIRLLYAEGRDSDDQGQEPDETEMRLQRARWRRATHCVASIAASALAVRLVGVGVTWGTKIFVDHAVCHHLTLDCGVDPIAVFADLRNHRMSAKSAASLVVVRLLGAQDDNTHHDLPLVGRVIPRHGAPRVAIA